MRSIISTGVAFSTLLGLGQCFLNATETTTQYVLANDRFSAAVNRSTGAIQNLVLDGQDLLGTPNFVTPTPGGATGSGNSGLGPYLDCYCRLIGGSKSLTSS